MAEFTHNNQVHSAMGKSPFMVLYGRNSRIVPDSPRPSPFLNPVAETFTETMAEVHRQTQKALEKAVNAMKTQYDRRKRTAIDYKVGDKVWLDARNLHLP